MPFGARILESGGVNFRLWAPNLTEVSLQLNGSQELPMIASEEGWFNLWVQAACNGSHYLFRLPNGLLVPDPASRFNPEDVHGPSEVIDPNSFDWSDDNWCGRPWEEAVIYELHVGSFTQSGNFRGVIERLEYLSELGITAIEIMPVADFPGRRNWGYDGVLPFAPDASYGRPEDFKQLINAAHNCGLMVLLDVVYNHFGPEGNFLHAYAPAFFNPRHVTPWGAAINFDAEGKHVVRDFFIHNAIYWLEEFHLDGLRLDAIHAICDDSSPDIIEELSKTVRHKVGRNRHVHLVLENEQNQARYLNRDSGGQPCQATAQWNDDIHHVLHVLASGETDGYYSSYSIDPTKLLGRCLTEGFAFQGEPSLFHKGKQRGEPSGHLPPTSFISFLQNHDQIGNRAFGERLCHIVSPIALEAVTAILLLAPQPPLLFMGEEFASDQPFLYFCDFSPELARVVTEGRRKEFLCFKPFSNVSKLENIPDPNAVKTFSDCVLDWDVIEHGHHHSTLELYRQLLSLRRQWIAPNLVGMGNGRPQLTFLSERSFSVRWYFDKSRTLLLIANLSEENIEVEPMRAETMIFVTSNISTNFLAIGQMPPWSVDWRLLNESHQ